MLLAKDVHRQASSFKLYLEYLLTKDNLWEIINFLSVHNKVFIFSGIIRDFFTGMVGPVRDIDIVVQDKKHLDLLFRSLRDIEVKRNSFGGFKLTYKKWTFDIWCMEDTWNIKRKGLEPHPYVLVNTVFFNFSAIVFDFQKETFIFSKEFLRFLNTLELSVVNPINPNIPLCIVNTLYYSCKYRFSISVKLKKWLKRNYDSSYDYTQVQKTHFGVVYFEKHIIDKFIKSL